MRGRRKKYEACYAETVEYHLLTDEKVYMVDKDLAKIVDLKALSVRDFYELRKKIGKNEDDRYSFFVVKQEGSKVNKCDMCGHIFEDGEEETSYENRSGRGERSAYESILCCPRCGGSFKEVEPCVCCGTYDHEPGKDYCDNCFSALVEKVKETFTEGEKALLDCLYERGEM